MASEQPRQPVLTRNSVQPTRPLRKPFLQRIVSGRRGRVRLGQFKGLQATVLGVQGRELEGRGAGSQERGLVGTGDFRVRAQGVGADERGSLVGGGLFGLRGTDFEGRTAEVVVHLRLLDIKQR